VEEENKMQHHLIHFKDFNLNFSKMG